MSLQDINESLDYLPTEEDIEDYINWAHKEREARETEETCESCEEWDLDAYAQASISYNDPINPVEWGVQASNTYEGQRARLVVFLPHDADSVLINKLDNCLDSQGKEVAGDRRDYWVTTQTVSQTKMELAAKIIRGWRLKIGWAAECV